MQQQLSAICARVQALNREYDGLLATVQAAMCATEATALQKHNLRVLENMLQKAATRMDDAAITAATLNNTDE